MSSLSSTTKKILFVEGGQDTARLWKGPSLGLCLHPHMHTLMDNEMKTEKPAPNPYHNSDTSQQSPAPTATSDATGCDERLSSGIWETALTSGSLQSSPPTGSINYKENA